MHFCASTACCDIDLLPLYYPVDLVSADLESDSLCRMFLDEWGVVRGPLAQKVGRDFGMKCVPRLPFRERSLIDR